MLTCLPSRLACATVSDEATGGLLPNDKFQPLYSSRLKTVVGAICVTHEHGGEPPRDLPTATSTYPRTDLPHPRCRRMDSTALSLSDESARPFPPNTVLKRWRVACRP
jgi:hypothetical protein